MEICPFTTQKLKLKTIVNLMKKKIAIISVTLICLLTTTAFGANKENYNKGWTEFSNNNRTEARKYFNLATSEADSKAEAFLSLALLDWSESKDINALDNFQKFYESSENPYPYFYAMFSLPFMNTRKILPESQLRFYERIISDPKMNGTLKAMLHETLGQYYMDSNNLKKSKELFSKMGALSNWQVLGTFNNISGSGFDKDWGAVSKAASDNVFKNNVDAEVKWYTPPANKPNNWFYFDYYFQLNSVIVYAQTFVNSPIEQEVYLRAGTSGSLKIWVNDALISTVPEERNCDLDIYPYKIKLNQGTNRILVQIGQSEITGANFLIRLTDSNANPIEGLTDSAVYADYTKSNSQPTNSILPFFAEEFFEEKVKREPNNLLNYLALGEIYLRNDKAYEGTHILKRAEKLAPKSSFVSYRLAEAYQRAQNGTDYSREIENIKLNDPDSFTALQYLYGEAFESEKYSEAENIAKKIKDLYGESTYTDALDIQILGANKKIDELIALSKKLYAKYPYSYEHMYMCYVIEDNVNQNTKAAIALLENYCKQYFDTNALETLAKRYLDLGETDKGLKTLRKRTDFMPYASGYWYSYATLLQGMQKYNEALTTMGEVKKLAPYMSYVYNTEGYIYRELKDTDKAKESFQKAIYYGPTSYDSRTQLRLLENKKEVFDLFPKTDLNELIAKAPTSADYPEENSVIVMNDNQLVFYPEGAQEHRAEIAIKILNQSGIEEWKDYGIGYNRNTQKLLLDKYEVIKANGQKVKAETNNYGRVIFTNLEVGDILHLDYRLQDFHTGELAKHFYDQLLMQYSVPGVYTSYSVLVPKDRDFKHIVTNGDIKPIISDVENMKLYQWISNNEPAIKDEPFMSPLSDVSPSLAFSSIPDWQFMSDWYRDLTANKFGANSDYILKETLTEILKGNENASQLEKAKLFYEYILKNITYSSVPFMQSNFIPQKASRTITTRLGDCKDVSTLFVAFCREVGIKANLVLLSSRENGKNTLILPSSSFNHCIAQLDVDGKTYYLELTDNKLPFGAALDSDLQSNILPIPYKNEKAGDKLLAMDMPFRMKNEIKRDTKINISNNDMNITFNSTRTGQLASFYRQKYTDMGSEDKLKDMNRIVASDWNVPVKVTNLSFTNLDNLADSVYYSFDLEAKNSLQEVAGMKIFKLPWSDAVKTLSMFALETRKYPFEFWGYLYCDRESENVNITLAQGKQFVEIPKNVKLECSVATYELIFDVKKTGEINAKRIFTKKKDVVNPEEYPAFREFMNSVSENDNKQYAIK